MQALREDYSSIGRTKLCSRIGADNWIIYLEERGVHLKSEPSMPKKHGLISYNSLIIGVVCFFIVFVTPTRKANVRNLIEDYVTFALTGVGIVLSIIGLLKKTEKNIIPVISLILSSSFLIFWIIVIFLLFTGQMDFAH